MTRDDLDRIERLNKAILAVNFSNATAPAPLEAIAMTAFLSGFIGLGALVSTLRWLGA
jgi:hypothetical protein